jgi:hypothetical protein
LKRFGKSLQIKNSLFLENFGDGLDVEDRYTGDVILKESTFLEMAAMDSRLKEDPQF